MAVVIAADVCKLYAPAPYSIDCCKKHNGAKSVVFSCVLCSKTYHLDCTKSSNFVTFGKSYGICNCRDDITLKSRLDAEIQERKNDPIYHHFLKKIAILTHDYNALLAQVSINKKEHEKEVNYYKEKLHRENMLESDKLKEETICKNCELNQTLNYNLTMNCNEYKTENIKNKEIINNLTQINEQLLDKTKILTDLCDSLKMNKDLYDKLNEKITSNNNTNSSQNLYSHVLQIDNKKSRYQNIPSVIIEVDKSHNLKNVTQTVKATLNKTPELQITKISLAKNQIFVQSNSVESTKKINTILTQANITDATIHIEEKKKPRIQIVGIEEDLTNIDITDIEKDIIKRNFLKDNSELKVVHKYQNNKSKKWNIIAELNSYTYEKIMNNRTVYYSYCRYKAYDDFNVNMCNKCCMYGHTERKCKRNDFTCKYCSQNHDSKDCPIKKETNKFNCTNCTYANQKANKKYDCNHSANDFKNCEYYKSLVIRNIYKTDYPYNPLEKTQNQSPSIKIH